MTAKETLSLKPNEQERAYPVETIKLNEPYTTVRNGQAHTVYPVRIKRDEVLVKESLDRMDSQSISMAKFFKFYKLSAK